MSSILEIEVSTRSSRCCNWTTRYMILLASQTKLSVERPARSQERIADSRRALFIVGIGGSLREVTKDTILQVDWIDS